MQKQINQAVETARENLLFDARSLINKKLFGRYMWINGKIDKWIWSKVENRQLLFSNPPHPFSSSASISNWRGFQQPGIGFPMSLWDSITVDSRQLQGKEKKQYGSVADNLGPVLVNNLKSNKLAWWRREWAYTFSPEVSNPPYLLKDRGRFLPHLKIDKKLEKENKIKLKQLCQKHPGK